MLARALVGRGVRRVVVLAAVGLCLTGCGIFADKKTPPPCPEISVLSEASKFTQFRPGPGRDITDITLQGEITGFKGSCSYDKGEGKMTVTLQVSMVFTRGPAAQSREAQAEYFIALPAFYPKPEAKRVMGVRLLFDSAADHLRITDNEVEITLPMKDFAKDLPNRAIYLGFQLDPAELEYNRQTNTQ